MRLKIIVILIYLNVNFVSCNSNQPSEKELELQKKELELKQKELELKEKQLDKLDREKAKELLISEFALPYFQTKTFDLVKIDDDKYRREYSEYFDGRKEWRKDVRDEVFLKLEKEGLITYSVEPYDISNRYQIGDGIQGSSAILGYLGFAYPKHIGKLTQKGMKYSASNPGDFKTCYMEFGEIKGIVENPGTNFAQVEFTLLRTNVTPFGEILMGYNSQDQEIIKSQTFIKYDDGWRISK